MCGFTGFLDSGSIHASDWPNLLELMSGRISHRGPDDAGFWTDVESGIGLAHRRLSIVDLSPAGHQPMMSISGRFVIAFNGEIYNHLDLRTELGKVSNDGSAVAAWRGHSDTETLLAGIERWGVKATLKKAVGMFAFALWDRDTRRLTLARDRMGEKPLYYGWQNGVFLFGSELKALQAHPAFKAEIDRDAITLFMRHNYIPAPHTIYREIHKLTPGCLLEVKIGHNSVLGQPDRYWSVTNAITDGRAKPFSGDEYEATDALDKLLRNAVRSQMMADVPLGAFLSGGIDSSTVVALMQVQSERPVKTFTIGFNEDGYNEAVHAKRVSKHLGTEHTELYVTPEQALGVIPRLPTLYDEPFSDISQIPTFLVSQLARQQVAVSLSGDAGDELFAGYTRYTMARDLWCKIERFPRCLRAVAAAGLRALPPGGWNTLAAPLRPLMPAKLSHANVGDKLHEGADLLTTRQVDELYLKLITHWEPEGLVLDANEPLTHLRGNPLPLSGLDEVQRMMALDAITYLPDDILVKVDRAAMGVSLETRVPFLDHRVVEFSWQLPQHMKLRDGVGKWALRQVLYRYVPKELVERPKMGFGVPIDSWLRGPLRGWAEDLLCEPRLQQQGYFNPVPIRQKWAEHLSGKRDWQYLLWDVLMFQAWLEEQRH